ncbi:hypothetical protein KHQ08_00165 (plasmid) [Pseudochrobactrum algeriensis]|uniref:hypothetical protein n=1 Tax=Pseudochrobactrum algeriensis TaxID=2834768 RepID=UPI001BCCD9F6|nr:hypothetical protein [Pseudochrobactrum algeriensis]QVQ35351.1 hypothetical protein KHQ08_00165 [Pseudochrobactrum algeriensis]QVQ41966.1 hypothetical protein KHQ07_18010 [Pseudochrobactrum algeriensis]QVQ42581.1 hypothetical protein KHQ09_00830 [Pseudochrobactrum algeriensis]
MAKNFESRLGKLKSRRSGPVGLQKGSMTWDGVFVPVEEAYQKRGTKVATTYALGAMQQVDPDYTAKSYEEGERVRNQLEKALAGLIPVEFDYQGSVPLNIHIRGVSDIDLLLLRTVYVAVDMKGSKAHTHYSEWNGDSGESLLSQLRHHAEQILINAFPEATVNIEGSKAITISGGSLRREVDVIPSHWYDTVDYQRTSLKKDRGVYIYLKKEKDRARNFPFLHMHEIQNKDDLTLGNTKKIIRLLKTLVADYEEGSNIELSSYDIASLVWHFDNGSMRVYAWNELSLLWVAKASLDSMVLNETRTKELITPDGTRKIIDKNEKFNSLVKLRNEVNDLVAEVAKELNGFDLYSEGEMKNTLEGSVINLDA